MENLVGRKVIIKQFLQDNNIKELDPLEDYKKHLNKVGTIIKINLNRDFYNYKIKFDDGWDGEFNKKEFILHNPNRRIS
jgi:hypothetical protein